MFQAVNFAVLDAARMEAEMDEARARNKAHESLFKGSAEAALTGVAPFLFRFSLNTDFASWSLTKGWGNAWGVFLKSSWPMPELLRHLQKLLRAKSEDGQQFIFRYYDPRVLRIFLPTCDAKQLREFFGDGILDYCIVEDEDPAFALRYRSENGVLRTDRLSVAEIIAELPEPQPLPVQEAPADEVVPPPDPALLAALKEKYPEMQEQEQEASEPPAAAEPAPQDEDEADAEPDGDGRPAAAATPEPKAAAAPPAKPAVKSRWNMFD